MNNLIKGVFDNATDQFTDTQLERFYALSSIYGDRAAIVVPLLRLGKGPNSYAKVYDKAVSVNKARGTTKEYFSSLTELLGSSDILTVETIVKAVSETRASLDMVPYVSRIKTASLADFFKLFIFEEIFEETEDESKGDFIGYRPLFKVLAE